MKLAGAVTEGSGRHNEDAFGVTEREGQVSAAWVLDGVTGINGQTYLPAASDARWLVERVQVHLEDLAAGSLPLQDLLRDLVARLEEEWRKAAAGLALPEDYDHPATCLLLAKSYEDGWQALRLGDSYLLSEIGTVTNHPHPPSDLGDLEAELKAEARRMRDSGVVDFNTMLTASKARHSINRRQRNTPGGNSVLVADQSALAKPEFITLGSPGKILLCTDGYYRAVDHYGLCDDAGLMAGSSKPAEVEQMLRRIRAAEASDPDCLKYPRFKPADDATAVVLI